MPRSSNPLSFSEPTPTILALILRASDSLTPLHLPCESVTRAHSLRTTLYAYRKALRITTIRIAKLGQKANESDKALQPTFLKQLQILEQIELSILIPTTLALAPTSHPSIRTTSDPIPNCTPDFPLALRITFQSSPSSPSYHITQRFAALADTLPVDEMANIEREAQQRPSAQPLTTIDPSRLALIKAGFIAPNDAELTLMEPAAPAQLLPLEEQAAAVDAATKAECQPAAPLPDPYNMPQPVRTTDDEPTYEEQ